MLTTSLRCPPAVRMISTTGENRRLQKQLRRNHGYHEIPKFPKNFTAVISSSRITQLIKCRQVLHYKKLVNACGTPIVEKLLHLFGIDN